MKTKFTLVMLFTLLITGVQLNAQTTFGISAGTSLANIHTDLEEMEYSSSKLGLTVGISADIPVSQSFSIQPALNFVQKGNKSNSYQFFGIKSRVNINYLELPVNINYNAPGGFFVGAGPSFSYGLSGKSKLTGLDGISESEKINFGSSEEDDLKRFELGGNVQAGYKINEKIMVTANYNFGLTNIVNEPEGKVKNIYFGLKLGFLFPSSSN